MSTHAHGVANAPRSRPAIRAPQALSVRFAALGGAVFSVLVVINSNLLSGSPSATDSGQETFNYLTGHQGRLQISAVRWGFAMAAALVWLSAHFRALRRVEGGTPGIALVALAGGMLAATSTLTGA